MNPYTKLLVIRLFFCSKNHREGKTSTTKPAHSEEKQFGLSWGYTCSPVWWKNTESRGTICREPCKVLAHVPTRRPAGPAQAPMGPPRRAVPLPCHSTDKSSRGWAWWWAGLTLVPLLSSCPGASLISDWPKREKGNEKKRAHGEQKQAKVSERRREADILCSSAPKQQAFGQNQAHLTPEH